MPYRWPDAIAAGRRPGMTADFAKATGYPDNVVNPAYDPEVPGSTPTIPNPVTKAQWLDDGLIGFPQG